MQEKVIYYHPGHQCYGDDYMRKGAIELAELLGVPFEDVDICRDAAAAEENRIFTGTIRVGDFKITYPGSGEEL